MPVSNGAVVLLYDDNTVSFESGHLLSTPFVCSRFSRPLHFAIFVYGTAPQDEEIQGPPVIGPELEPDEDATDTMHKDHEPRPNTDRYVHGIRFVDLAREQCPADIRAIACRMQIIYGHPSANDLVQFVARQGASLPVLLCVRALGCETCERKQKRGRPQPAKMPAVLRVS